MHVEPSRHRTSTAARIRPAWAGRVGLTRAAHALGWGAVSALLVMLLSRGAWIHGYGSPPFLVLAFWAAVFDFQRRGGGAGNDALRLAIGLALGALLAHLGWALLHPALIAADPDLLLEVRGFSSLFLPLGVPALAVPGQGDRTRFLAPAVGCLALGLAVARLGCILAGCCLGAPTHAFWAVSGRHPTRWLEWAGLLAICLTSYGLPRSLVAPITLAGYGALRLALAPLREADPAGPALFASSWLAAGWLLLGGGWALRRRIRRLAPPTRTLP